MSDPLEGIRRELKRVLDERDRIRQDLSDREVRRASPSPAYKNGLEACALLCDIAEVLSGLGKERFFSEYHTSAADLSKLVSLCEDEAREAGPLIEKDAQWMGNRIRTQLI
ncbi:MAG: hypothetical protein ACLQDL_05890 [Spirochaetia bacterium]